MNAKTAVDLYIAMERNLTKVQGLVLELLAHPGAADTQRLEVAARYQALVASVDSARGSVSAYCRKAPMGVVHEARALKAYRERKQR